MELKLGLAAFSKLKTRRNPHGSVGRLCKSHLGWGIGSQLLAGREFIMAGPGRGFDLNLGAVGLGDTNFFQHS